MSTLENNDKERISYIGVNHTYPTEAEANAKKYNISSVFFTTNEFDQQHINADIIFVINVLHELPLKELPKQLYNIFRALKSDGCIFVHEMLHLPHGEANFFNWKSDEISALFNSKGFELIKRPIHYSKSGVPLTTIIAHKIIPFDTDEISISNKCLQIYASRKNYCRTTWLGVEHPLIFRDFSVSVIV